MVRTVTDPDNQQAEFAMVVRSDQQRQGIGRALLAKMIDYCRGRGTREMVGQIMADNVAMRGLARKLGFRPARRVEDNVVEVRLPLNDEIGR